MYYAHQQGVAANALTSAFCVPRFQRDHAATVRDHFVVSCTNVHSTACLCYVALSGLCLYCVISRGFVH